MKTSTTSEAEARRLNAAEIIRRNDDLRRNFRGGRIEVRHGPYDIDDRTIGRKLCVIARYNTFDVESLHDEGICIFAGFSVAWRIEDVGSECVMRVWVNADVLNGTG